MAVTPNLAALGIFQFDFAAHRKLDEELKHLDLRLQLWAKWAKPYYGLGYPTRSVTERAGEGGILAKDMTVRAEPEWPSDACETDRAVAQLPTRHMAAIMATYFNLELPLERRAQIYEGLARNLAKTRPSRLNGAKAATLGRDVFKGDLLVARWTLKASLRL